MASTTAAPTAKPSATPQQLMTAREEDHAFLFTALLNAAFRAEELGVTPDQFLEICRAAAAPHCKLVDSQQVVIEPSPRLKELGVTPERFLKMCELIVGVMRQLLMENLG
ncbi:MAG: hypothetical protein WBP65_09750 [Candidatus Sulfotelmatobacter sp.]|jgi:hypothetical protein